MFTALRSRLLHEDYPVCDDAFVLALDENIKDVIQAGAALEQGFALASRLMRRKYGMLQAVVILPEAVFNADYLVLAKYAFGVDHDHLVVMTLVNKPGQSISEQIARGADYCAPNAVIRGVVSRQDPGYVLATVASTRASTSKRVKLQAA
jgi:hypothetical protein